MNSPIMSLQNPVFQLYAITAALMLLKLMLQPWFTVRQMLKEQGGYLNPEDLRRTPVNRHPMPSQLAVNDRVERSRRMNRNDLESIPGTLIAGLLFVLMEPPLLLAQILFVTYVLFRALHAYAYATARIHDIRAAFWSLSSLPALIMVVYVLATALRGAG